MSDTAPKRSWLRPGGIILMLIVAGMFVWGNLSTRGPSARDSLCVDPSYITETEERFIYVQGLPLAFFAEHEWGGWPRREYLFWLPLLLNVAVCAAAMASVAVAWRVWSTRPGRKAWLQYHLSTAVILMFVAGLVLWANCAPSTEGGLGIEFSVDASGTVSVGRKVSGATDFWIYRYYGWPLPVWEVDSLTPANHKWLPAIDAFTKAKMTKDNGPFRTNVEAAAHVVYDVLACLGIVLFVGLICEAWIVWRAQRRKESPSA